MARREIMLVCAMVLGMLLTQPAWAQCRSGGAAAGGGTGGATGDSGAFPESSNDTGGRLLTGPGSWYSMMLQQHQAYELMQRQQYVAALVQAQQRAERNERRDKAARERRADELYRREARRRR